MNRHSRAGWVLLLAALGGFIPAVGYAATIQIDRGTRHQSIEGFGFFGAHDVWWGAPTDMVNAEWIDMVLNDLGMSIWRNEYYAPSTEGSAQDADWDKQRPVVEALRDAARSAGIPLKTLLTVWSPPADMKCANDEETIYDGTPHEGGTKEGGVLCPSSQEAFAQWLLDGLRMYRDVDVDVYGLSFQNEPLFVEPYNSCYYPRVYYAETLAAIGPVLHEEFPELKLFGSENMLAIECGATPGTAFDPYWYTAQILDRAEALEQLGAFAVHGYSDGVLATPTSAMAQLWTNYYDAVHDTGKPIWMTETSGFVDAWEGEGELQGAMSLAQAIWAALYYGKLSTWVWWQGSELGGVNEFSMMQSTQVSKRYYVSKQYYRFLRPGAVMLEATSDDSEVMAAAFEHQGIGNFVTILLNGGEQEKAVNLEGDGVPEHLDAYRTSEQEDCAAVEAGFARDAITLPARSITTLISGSFLDQGAAGAGGTAGAPQGGQAGAAQGGALGEGGTGQAGEALGGAESQGGSVGGALEVGGTSDAGAAGVDSSGAAGAEMAQGGAGTTPDDAGAAGETAGTNSSDDASADDGGCSCRLPAGRRTSGALLGLLLLLGLGRTRTARRD